MIIRNGEIRLIDSSLESNSYGLIITNDKKIIGYCYTDNNRALVYG